MDYPETATPGDIESEQWMVYDDMCWFKLLGTQGFSHIHVSLYSYVCLLGTMDKLRK